MRKTAQSGSRTEIDSFRLVGRVSIDWLGIAFRIGFKLILLSELTRRRLLLISKISKVIESFHQITSKVNAARLEVSD